MAGSIYDIREDRVSIEGKSWNDPTLQQLVWKNIYLTQKMIDFWQPYLDRGQMLMDMYDGKILTDTQRAVYEQIEDKIVIEPPIMKSPIRSLLNHAIQSRRSGAIETEEGDLDSENNSADEIETVDICLKFMEKKTKEQVKTRDAFHDSMVSCYPNVLVYQKRRPSRDNPLKYTLVHYPWNSCVFGPVNTNEPDYSDIRELVFFNNFSMAELIDAYPDLEETIANHFASSRMDDKAFSSLMKWDDSTIATDIEYMRSIYNAAYGNLNFPGRMVPTFSRLFPIKKTEKMFVRVDGEVDEIENEENGDYVVLPEQWSEKRKNEWMQANGDKYAGPIERETYVLWQTVFTSTGLVLSNKKHWFQECGQLPATIIIPCMINGKPSGPAVDMSPETLRNCVARIEYLDDVRKGGGQLLFTKEGVLTKESTENITAESNKSLGVAYVSKDFSGSVNDALKVIERNPSTAWRDYGEYEKQTMSENTRINETVQGEFAPRQSGVAKDKEIMAALGVSTMYFDNFNLQWENHQNLKLAIIPYNFDESMMVVEAHDEKENITKSTTINIPQYDIDGNKVSVVNDVTSKRYKWVVSPVDDSPTAKSRMMQDAILIINGSAGPLQSADPTGSLLASFWASLDNPIMNEAGRRLQKDAKLKGEQESKAQQEESRQKAQEIMMKSLAEMEKARKAGVSLTFTGEQLAQYPNLFSLYQSLVQQSGMNQNMIQNLIQPATQSQNNSSPQPAPSGGATEQMSLNDALPSTDPFLEMASA